MLGEVRCSHNLVLTGRMTGVAVTLVPHSITAFGFLYTLAVYVARVIWRHHKGKTCP